MTAAVSLSVLLERLPEPAILVERPGGAIAGWNDAAADLWGPDIAQAALATLLGSVGAARLLSAASAVWAAERLEVVVRRPNGRVAELIASVAPLGDDASALLLVLHDVTTERMLARQLRETQRVAMVGCWEATLPDWRFCCSDECCRLFGFEPRDAVLDRGLLLAALHPDDRDATVATLKAAARDLGPVSVVCRLLVHGHERVVQCRAEVLPGQDGLPARMAGTVQDVTERVTAERALTEQYERLRALDRLKDQFLSMVSHELRTPLTSIKGYAELLEDEIEGPLSPGHHAFVAGIQANSRRLERMVDDLLEVARYRAGELRLAIRPVDLHDAIARAAEALAAPAEEAGVRLEIGGCAGEGHPCVLADPFRLEQALVHVLDNAVKFSPRGGAVTIAHAPDGTWLSVADEGPGIPPEALACLFDPFYQADHRLTRSHNGAGLGLFVARTLLEAMGGAIEAANRPGGGAVFRLRLPTA